MKSKLCSLALSVLPLIFVALVSVVPARAQGAPAQSAPSNLTVTYPTGFAVSPPVSQISQPALPTVQTIIPLRPRPLAGGGALAPSVQDQALQTAPGGALELEDEGGNPRFPGVGANGWAPPDTNMAVGPNHILQTVNIRYAIYSKSGALVSGPFSLSSLWAPLGSSNGCATNNGGDVVAQYDKLADRFVVTQLGGLSAPYSECIAISQTSDPTGAYWLYSYSYGTMLNDYPKFGVWPTATNSAYLATYNMFANGQIFSGGQLCAFDRTKMLAGNPTAQGICYTLSFDGGYLPSDLDGSTPPVDGTPGYFLTYETLSSLRMYRLAPNFSNPNASTLSVQTPDIPVVSFSEACAPSYTCVPQSGTSQQLDSLGDRLMYRLAYRNFGDHEALVVNHSVANGSSVGVRWYELRRPLTGAFTLYQQGTFAPADSTYRWMGSAAMDHAGDIAIGYSASSSNLFPAIRYTGRIPTDAQGTMRAEISLLEGTGSQTGNSLSRWGDYSALRIDPSDDCTFWYTNEYIPSNGSYNWATFIGSFKFANCGAPPTPDFSVSASPASQPVVQGSQTSYTVTVAASGGFTGSVSLGASQLPSGATATFSPTSITGGSGTSTMSVATNPRTPTGIYTLMITGSIGSLNHSTTVTLAVNSAATPNFSISASPSSQTVTQGTGTSYIATVTPSGGFTGSVSLNASQLPSGATATF